MGRTKWMQISCVSDLWDPSYNGVKSTVYRVILGVDLLMFVRYTAMGVRTTVESLVRKLPNLCLTQSWNLPWEMLPRALLGQDKCTGIISWSASEHQLLCAWVRQAYSKCSHFVMQTSVLVFPNFLHFLRPSPFNVAHYSLKKLPAFIAWSLLQFCWCGTKIFFQHLLNKGNTIRNVSQIFKNPSLLKSISEWFLKCSKSLKYWSS